MKRFRLPILFVLLLAVATALILLRNHFRQQERQVIPSAEKLNSPLFTIGVEAESQAATAAAERFPSGRIRVFDSPADGFAALKYGKLDAFASSRHLLQYAAGENPELAILPEKIGDNEIVVAAAPNQTKLIDEVNAFIRRSRADGTSRDMYRRWVEGAERRMPPLPPPTAPARKLRVGTEGHTEPMSYRDAEGRLIGYDLEFILRLSRALDAETEVVTMETAPLLDALEQGEIDLVIANLESNAPRRQRLALSLPYLDTDIGLLIERRRLPSGLAGTGKTARFRRLNDFNGTRIGSINGSVFAEVLDRRLTGVTHANYQDVPGMISALRSNKVVAVAQDEPVARLYASAFSDLTIFPEMVEEDRYSIALRKNSPYTAEFSRVIEKFQHDGTLEKIRKYWLSSGLADKPMPPIDNNPAWNGSAGVLRVVHDTITQPMSYVGSKNESLGFDVELVHRIARELNYRVEFTPTTFYALFEALQTNRADVAVTTLSVTEERKKIADFTIPYHYGGVVLLVNRRDVAARGGSGIDAVTHDFLSLSRAGVYFGSTSERLLTREYPSIRLHSFTNFPDMIGALLDDRIDAGAGSYVTLSHAARTHLDRLEFLSVTLQAEGNAIALRKGETELRDKINRQLREYRSSGYLRELENRWLQFEGPYPPFEPRMHEEGAPVLRVAISAEREPISFLQNGEFAGYDIELISRIAFDLGMRPEFRNMKFHEMIPSLRAGETDVVISNLSWSEDRAKLIDFSDIYFDNPQRLLVRKEVAARLREAADITEISQLLDRRIGVLSRTILESIARDRLVGAQVVPLQTVTEMSAALATRKIDAFLLDEPVARALAARIPGIHVLDEPVADTLYGYALPPGKEGLRDQIDQELRKMERDGSLGMLQQKWFGRNEAQKTLRRPAHTGTHGTLRVVVNTDLAPFCYVKKEEIIGYDIEVLQRIAEVLDLKLEITRAPAEPLSDLLRSGRFDLAAGCITITDDRKKEMLFSSPNYRGSVVALTREAARQPVSSPLRFTLPGEIKAGFTRAFLAEDRYLLILRGLGVTLLLTVSSVLAGTILGIAGAALSRSRYRAVRGLAKTAIVAVRGTPVLITLMILYYIVFGRVDISSLWVAIIAFSIDFGGSIAGTFAYNVDLVSQGQLAAARALGLRRSQILREIQLPQFIHSLSDFYTKAVVTLFEMTSVVGYIAILDLTKVSDIIRGRTYEAFFPLVTTAIIYFVLAYLLTQLLRAACRRFDPSRRPRQVKGV